jgi:hypothetical protein
MESLLKEILKYWQVWVAIGGAFIAVYTTIKFKLPDIEKRLRKFENMHLMTKQDCLDNQAHCQQLICNKIDAIRTELNLMDRKRQNARAEFNNELKQINKFMGRVEQFMTDHLNRYD